MQRIILSISNKVSCDFLIEIACIESVDQFGEYCHFNSIKSLICENEVFLFRSLHSFNDIL